VSLARFAFQACSFSHSDISPLWNQEFTSDPNQIIADVSDILTLRDHLPLPADRGYDRFSAARDR
jgi:hypothetical protein